MERYEILEMIGEGSFGRVYKARVRQGHEVVALKIIRKRGRSEKELASLRQEYEVQLHLNHPNIIQMLDSFETENEIVVVTEYADKELYEILAKEGYLSEERVKKIVCDLVSALHYLHSRRILHRDLKPQNILMVTDDVAKLCDFGFARNMSTGTHVLTSIKGTPLYMAPELIEENPYDHTADLWSLGCIIYELLVGYPPFCTTSILHLVHMIKNDEVVWPDFISPDCKDFLQRLLAKDPSKRLTWPELIEHPYLKNEQLILEQTGAETPFTDHPTASQTRAKEIQKQEIAQKTAGQTKVLSQTMKKLEEYEKKVKLLEELGAKFCITSDKDGCGSGSTKASTRAQVGDCLSPATDRCSKACCREESKFLGDSSVGGNVKTIGALSDSGDSCSSRRVCVGNIAVRDGVEINCKDGDDSSVGVHCEDEASSTVAQCSTGVKTSEVSGELENTYSSRDICVGNVTLLEGARSNCEEEDHHKGAPKEEAVSSAAVFSSEGVVLQGHQNSAHLNISDHQRRTGEMGVLNSWQSNDNNYPIENEEWLAFLQQTMEEVMEEDVEAMLQRNFIGIVLSPLQNPGVSCRVVEYVACLLSLPFVVKGIAKEDISTILKVYMEAKVVPNLIYACKLFLRRKSYDSTEPVTSPSGETVRAVSELSADELQALECIFLLMCHLVYAEHDFRLQFCDAVAMLNAAGLLRDFLSLGRRKVRVVADLLAILLHILLTLPENAGLVEKIVFKPSAEGGGNVIDSSRLLSHHNSVLKSRSCRLLQLLSRYSCLALQTSWNRRLSKDIDSLLEDEDDDVRKAAVCAVNELKNLSFFNQSGVK